MCGCMGCASVCGVDWAWVWDLLSSGLLVLSPIFFLCKSNRLFFSVYLHITCIRTRPPSLNSAGVWRSGHTRGPTAPQPPQTPNQQNNSSSRPLPPREANRQQGCGKTAPLAPLALQYFLIVSD